MPTTKIHFSPVATELLVLQVEKQHTRRQWQADQAQALAKIAQLKTMWIDASPAFRVALEAEGRLVSALAEKKLQQARKHLAALNKRITWINQSHAAL